MWRSFKLILKKYTIPRYIPTFPPFRRLKILRGKIQRLPPTYRKVDEGTTDEVNEGLSKQSAQPKVRIPNHVIWLVVFVIVAVAIGVFAVLLGEKASRPELANPYGGACTTSNGYPGLWGTDGLCHWCDSSSIYTTRINDCCSADDGSGTYCCTLGKTGCSHGSSDGSGGGDDCAAYDVTAQCYIPQEGTGEEITPEMVAFLYPIRCGNCPPGSVDSNTDDTWAVGGPYHWCDCIPH